MPLTVVAAIGAASRHGALTKGGAAVEALGRIRTVETGTLTRNTPEVIDTLTVGDVTNAEALRAAAALEARSEHPLAQAILAAAGPDIPAATDVTAVVGHGLTGQLELAALRLGKPGWIDPGPLRDEVDRLQQSGATVLLLERDQALVAAIAVRDELRPEAIGAIAGLRRSGMKVAMLTGDNTRTAHALAAQAGITTVHADLLPEDKARLLPELAGGKPIAMVGDGITDAPALATADIGIAMVRWAPTWPGRHRARDSTRHLDQGTARARVHPPRGHHCPGQDWHRHHRPHEPDRGVSRSGRGRR